MKVIIFEVIAEKSCHGSIVSGAIYLLSKYWKVARGTVPPPIQNNVMPSYMLTR